MQGYLETLSDRTKRQAQPNVARRCVLQLKLAETVAEGARHHPFPLHQPDGHVDRAGRRLGSVRKLANQSDQPGSQLVFDLQIEGIAASLVQRVPRETVLSSHASRQRLADRVVHESGDPPGEAGFFGSVQRVDRLRIPDRVFGRLVAGLASRRRGDTAQDVHGSLTPGAAGREMRFHG